MRGIIKKNRVLIIEIIVISAIFIFAFEYYNYLKREKIEELGEYPSIDEFVKTIDCTPYIEKSVDGKMCISFDIRSKKEGKVRVYLVNGHSQKYYFEEYISVTTNYNHIELNVEPYLYDSKDSKSYLAFYGGYGTDVKPSVKNIEIIVNE